MKNILCAVLFYFWLSSISFGQSLNGIYQLTDQHKGESGYIIFSKNTFVFFILKQNLSIAKPDFFIDQFGTGEYSLDQRSLILKFKRDNDRTIYPFVNDSLATSFSSDLNSDKLKFLLHLESKEGGKTTASLYIETDSNQYHANLKLTDSIVQITIPKRSSVRSVKLFAIGYKARELPFDYHFNNFEYFLKLGDSKNIITFIVNERRELVVKSRNKDVFKFASFLTLSKIDDSERKYLYELAENNQYIKAILNN